MTFKFSGQILFNKLRTSALSCSSRFVGSFFCQPLSVVLSPTGVLRSPALPGVVPPIFGVSFFFVDVQRSCTSLCLTSLWTLQILSISCRLKIQSVGLTSTFAAGVLAAGAELAEASILSGRLVPHFLQKFESAAKVLPQLRHTSFDIPMILVSGFDVAAAESSLCSLVDSFAVIASSCLSPSSPSAFFVPGLARTAFFSLFTFFAGAGVTP
mmetsp:Transcript_125101/g.198176  ORF Transcript_125101/g.198176 Transcript_125101/m.198176 type:complete len:212 (-) Transcript_125101:638-1273(-)